MFCPELSISMSASSAIGASRACSASIASLIAPGFVIAVDQALPVGGEEQHLTVGAAGTDGLQDDREGLQIGEISGVDAHRRRGVGVVARQFLPKRRQQRDRQVVDAVKAHVLQGVQRRGLARPGQATDDDYAL
jgi:hypothetical protein